MDGNSPAKEELTMATKHISNNPVPHDEAATAAKLKRIHELEAEVEMLKGMKAAQHSFAGCPAHSFAECDYDLRKFIDSNIVAIHRADFNGNLKELNDAMVN